MAPLPRGRGETILVVEDQKLMQVVTSKVLTDLGYRVMVSSTVLDGFDEWRSHEGEINLILTDFIFEGSLTGMDLLQKVKARAPQLPILIVSGSWLPDAKKDPPLPGNVVHMAKPYRRAQLAIAVRTLLDDAQRQVQAKPRPDRTST